MRIRDKKPGYILKKGKAIELISREKKRDMTDLEKKKCIRTDLGKQ